MPCRYDPSPEEEKRWAEEKDEKLKKAWLKEFKPKLDELTILLCETCEYLQKNNFLPNRALSPELNSWWNEHLEKDRIRLNEEAKLESEKLKLTEAIKELNDPTLIKKLLKTINL